MKIVFASYNACCQNASGGVQNRLRKIASLVADRGFEVELFNPFETKLEKGDILHVFMLSLDTFSLIQFAKSKGVKVVISTIVPLIGTMKLKVYKSLNILPIVTTYKINRMSLNYADALITESQRESGFIGHYFGVNTNKMNVIPNGVDVEKNNGIEIFEKIGNVEKYVLQVGRFDENKNQINVIKALKNTNIPVVFIGGPGKGNEGYYDKCLKEADGCNNIHFLGWLDSNSPLLKSAFAHADTVIVPSFYETFGLTAIEGGCMGAKLAFSNILPITDYPVFSSCMTFSPGNVSQIRETVLNVFNQEKDRKFTESVISTFNWETVIDEHIRIYNKI